MAILYKIYEDERMKIVFLIGSLEFGGAERTVLYLSSYLAEHGDEVIIYAMTNTVNYMLNPKIKIVYGNLPTEHNSCLRRYANIVHRTIAINHAIKKEKPELVFCIMASMAKYLMLDKHRKYKLIVSERTNPKYVPSGQYELEKKIFKRADGIIFQTERAKENFKGLPEEKSTVIPNAVGNEYVAEAEWKADGRNAIAAIGRLSAEKDYPVMIKAFHLFLSTHPGFTLEIYGVGGEKEKIEKCIAEYGMENVVIMQGVCRDAIKRISDARCYLLTSVCEGMPNTLMEAMAIGMPCISTDCEYGPAELIRNGENGLLVPVGDAKAISEAIGRMVDDRKFAAKCGRNARKILETNSIENVCSRYKDFFNMIGNVEVGSNS